MALQRPRRVQMAILKRNDAEILKVVKRPELLRGFEKIANSYQVAEMASLF
jgi:hypothetical protein